MNGCLKAAALFLVIGTIGSVELDRIGFMQAMFQILCGFMAWVISEYRVEIRRLRRKLQIKQLNRRQKYDRSRNSVQCLQR